jgi:hypothetical protein
MQPNTRDKFVGFVIFMGIFLLMARPWSSGSGSDQATPDTAVATPASTPTHRPQAKFKGKVTSITPINPATVIVGGRLKNVGDRAGRYFCLVSVQDPSRTYKGSKFIEGTRKLAPGVTGWYFRATITVENEGAAWVTSGDVTC